MTDAMLILGDFPFSLATASYQTLRRRSAWRWASQDRLGAMPAQQYVGPGSDEMTLTGKILTHWRGGIGQINQMRAAANNGVPMMMVAGDGTVLGEWVITSIEETQDDLMRDGAPGVINFTMTIKGYGE